jgi:hypothetical protein
MFGKTWQETERKLDRGSQKRYTVIAKSKYGTEKKENQQKESGAKNLRLHLRLLHCKINGPRQSREKNHKV